MSEDIKNGSLQLPGEDAESLEREPLISVEKDGNRTVLTIDLDGLAAEADSAMVKNFEDMRNNAEYDTQAALLEYISKVHRALAQLGMNDAELARQMGVTRSYVSRILNAPPNLTVMSLGKLAHALGGKLRITLEFGEKKE